MLHKYREVPQERGGKSQIEREMIQERNDPGEVIQETGKPRRSPTSTRENKRE